MIQRKPITVKTLMSLLKNSIKKGVVKETDELWIASDEEGNSYSPVVFEGIQHTDDNRITLYPLFPEVI